MASSSATPWTVAHQAPLSMTFPRQEEGSGLPFPSPGDLPDPGITPASSVWQVDASLLNHQGGNDLRAVSTVSPARPGEWYGWRRPRSPQRPSFQGCAAPQGSLASPCGACCSVLIRNPLLFSVFPILLESFPPTKMRLTCTCTQLTVARQAGSFCFVVTGCCHPLKFPR